MSDGLSQGVTVLLVASPWIVPPLIGAWRLRGSRDLAEWPAIVPAAPPLVSVVVPARDEAANIARCVRSILSSTWPSLEVVVVDDQSRDDTGAIARAIAREDARVRVVDTPPLPDGWLGKPWACATGARAARGTILLFADADTTHAPTLVARGLRAMADERLDMLTVAGHQELGSFWERVVQPQVFAFIGARYGSTERVNRSSRVEDKIANGQCILVRRAVYEAIGGHGAVRDRVAEDLAVAQRLFAAGYRTALLLGRRELSTRMYTSLGTLAAGWRKNLYVGGRGAMPGGRVGRALYPLLLPLPGIMSVLPPVALALGLAGALPSWLAQAAALASAALLAWWVAVYRWMEAPVAWALLYPLGGTVLLAITLQSLARGRRVAWKGRRYLAR